MPGRGEGLRRALWPPIEGGSTIVARAGGINTAATVRATRSRSNNAHRQGGYGDGDGRSFDDLDRCLQVVAFVSMAIFS